MSLKRTFLAALVLAGLMFPGAVLAGVVTNDLHLRTGPGTAYRSILVIPAGSPVEVYRCSSWCEVNYRGYVGWASARYIAGDGYYRPTYAPPAYFPPPTFGYVSRPWWDRRYGAWYDGRRWYYRGRWYDRPGFSIYFRFD